MPENLPMNTLPTLPDARGNLVRPGDRIRILGVSLDPDMEDDERDMVDYMIGSVCEVESIDRFGQAWVTMWWNNGDGVQTTTIALTSAQIERV